jgi:short-subunit dehydrogenase
MEFSAKYGPWALITGASEGTGAAFARQLADAGLNLILVARREGPLAALADQVRAKGVECVTASVDLSAPEASRSVAAAAGEREVGLFIANAGADTINAMFLDRDIGQWDGLVNLNVATTMRNCHHFGKAMRQRGRGGMIIVGSGACYGGLSGLSVYTAVKAFELCFGEGLWAEMRHHNVDVLNLILGRTDTPAHRKSLELAGMPVPDDLADPEDVARVGLAQLPHGPIHNWGQASDEAGSAPNSPDARRARILAIEQISAAYAGKPPGQPA